MMAYLQMDQVIEFQGEGRQTKSDHDRSKPEPANTEKSDYDNSLGSIRNKADSALYIEQLRQSQNSKIQYKRTQDQTDPMPTTPQQVSNTSKADMMQKCLDKSQFVLQKAMDQSTINDRINNNITLTGKNSVDLSHTANFDRPKADQEAKSRLANRTTGSGELIFERNQVFNANQSECGASVESSAVKHLREKRDVWTCPETGNKYDGDWVGKIKDGLGTMIWAVNGTTYIGQWRNNVPHGQGKFVKANGDVHEGSWYKGRAHGEGKFIQKDKDGRIAISYEGQWQFGKKHGQGIEKWHDGSCYQGLFEDDLKNGEGVLQMADSSSYRGEFKDGMIEGFGFYIWKNKKQYQGNWKASKMNGFGKLVWNDGVEYLGFFKDDQFHGQGEYKWKDGKIYIGGW